MPGNTLENQFAENNNPKNIRYNSGATKIVEQN
jgi:hypothetical protein